MLTLYGIKNCDTVKKARLWLEAHDIEYQYHDFRQDGLEEKLLQSWIEKLGRDTLINKRSTTWRNLSDKDKNISSNTHAVKLLLANPTLIKRPVVQKDKKILVGFKEIEFSTI